MIFCSYQQPLKLFEAGFQLDDYRKALSANQIQLQNPICKIAHVRKTQTGNVRTLANPRTWTNFGVRSALDQSLWYKIEKSF